MNVYTAVVTISYSGDIVEVAERISRHVFGGIRFVPTDEFDELPGMVLSEEVLGYRITLCGKAEKYDFRLNTNVSRLNNDDIRQCFTVSINDYVLWCLTAVPGVRAIS